MVNKLWSHEEERVFWKIIIPKSPKRYGFQSGQDGLDWKECAAAMTKFFGPEARRVYTNLSLFEHWFQNAVKQRFSPHAAAFATQYIQSEAPLDAPPLFLESKARGHKTTRPKSASGAKRIEAGGSRKRKQPSTPKVQKSVEIPGEAFENDTATISTTALYHSQDHVHTSGLVGVGIYEDEESQRDLHPAARAEAPARQPTRFRQPLGHIIADNNRQCILAEADNPYHGDSLFVPQSPACG